MTTVYNDAGKTTLADGTVITSANTNGGGNTLLTAAGTSLNTVKRITADLPYSDTAAYEIPAQTATSSYWTISPGTYTATVGAGVGFWFQVTSIPTAAFQLIIIGGTGATYVGHNNAGNIYLVVNNTTVFTSASPLTLNAWYWLTFAVSSASTTTGVARVALYNKDGSLVQTFSGTTYNTTAVSASQVQIGKLSAAGNTTAMRFAGIQSTNNNNALLPPQIVRGRGWLLDAA